MLSRRTCSLRTSSLPTPIERVAASKLETISLTILPQENIQLPPVVRDLQDPLSKSLQKFTSPTLTSKKAQPRASVRSKLDPLSARRTLNSNPHIHCKWLGAGFLHYERRTYVFLRFCTDSVGRDGARMPVLGSWTINIPMGLGKMLGTLNEFVSKFTEDRISYATARWWFNIAKARRVPCYELDVGVGESIKRAVAVCHSFGSR
jgi:hypothetical protein